MKATRRFAALFLALALLAAPAAAAEDAPAAWASEGVTRAIVLGMVPAHLQARYTQPATRAEFCALAVAVYEKIIEEEILERRYFSDTDDINVQKIGGLGIVSGKGESLFAPDDRLNREEAAVILTKTLKLLEVPLSPAPHGHMEAFADRAEMSAWALTAIGEISTATIMNGTGGGRFSPKGSYEIQQCIFTLLKVYDLAMESSQSQTAMLRDYALKVVELVNIERAKEGLGALATSELLHAAATVRAAEAEIHWSHERPDGRSCFTVLTELGIAFRGAGENLAKVYRTPESVVEGWMNSPDHRENIMQEKFGKIGVGLHMDHEGTLYWAQFFTD